MQDFTRIGGAITSAPLNDNFRRLNNNIDMTNTNIIWDADQGIVNTIVDMVAIKSPKNGQACYVISSGELYRYYTKDNQWHKIMDLGNTFRQGFLNSGAVVLEDDIKYVNINTLSFPNMLVYFKNADGDGRYLRGMYLIKATEISFDLSSLGAYSIYVNKLGEFDISSGMPTQDDPNKVYLGSFLVDKNNEILKDFIYTIPDIAYTADRGQFFVNGGVAEGLNLITNNNHDNTINRVNGYYYDEGINYPKGQTDDFPYNNDNGSNFNLKGYEAQSPVSKLYYIAPEDSLKYDIKETSGLVFNKYWANKELTDVPAGYYTIQEHLVTPNGQNIIVYGTKIYNSISDAVSNINNSYGLDMVFPYVQASRIVIGNTGIEDASDPNVCQCFTIGRLAQVGTISPEFADTAFKLYSGTTDSNTPASARFSLDQLEAEDFNDLYNLLVLPYHTTRHLFYNDKKYVGENINPIEIVKDKEDLRNESYGHMGYDLADQKDLEYLEQRVSDIEAELWSLYKESEQRFNQSVRYRLFNSEKRLDDHDISLNDHNNRIDSLEKHKVNKTTTINGYTLGDTEDIGEIKNVVLYTDDIQEKDAKATNLWYTEERVKSNTDVANATKHVNSISKDDNANGHIKVNPHNISTDDINLLEDTKRLFVTADEERRIRADKLPDDTIKALQDLDEKNMDYLHISYQEGSSQDPGPSIIDLGDARKIRFFQDGVKLNMDADGETAIIECIGQVDDSIVMYRNRYATLEAEYPDLYGGYVDKAVNAEYAYYVGNIDQASASQYYGTNADGEIGIFDLPRYVSSANAESYASIDQVTFEPIDGSVQEKHLEKTLKDKINNNYHAIYDGGVLTSAEVNTFDFGNNLHVVVSGHKATINAIGAGEPAENKFTSLEDVDVTYTNNEGKMIIVNSEGTGLTLAKTPSTQEYMLRSIYVEPTDVSKIKKAVHADNATLADSANNALAVNNKSVNNSSTTEGLWTASKIISNTDEQIKKHIHSGTTVPDSSVGVDGDIYILIES